MNNFSEILDKIGMLILCICIPGIIFILDSIRVIRNKSRMAIGRNFQFKWKKPSEIKGKEASKFGKFELFLGILLLLSGILAIIGSYYR